MRLCVPTIDDRGLEGRISPHFGSAPYFTVVDTDTGRTDVIPNGHARHEHGSCRPVDRLGDRAVDAVVVRGLGARAFQNLRALGIQVLMTDRWDVLGAVTAFGGGELEPMSTDAACHGGHRH